MLYLYDNAIANDLRNSFADEVGASSVSVCDAEMMIDIAAQFENDKISLPLVGLTRDLDLPLDDKLWNFTKVHQGIVTVMDTDTNELYYEKSLPVKLGYNLTILAANTADRDEIERELLFKYSQMFFLTIKLPYEADRKVRFGVTIDPNTSIERKSGTVDYIKSGQLYQSIIHLNCQGCVLVHYTPVKLRRMYMDKKVEILDKMAESRQDLI